jgi:hypothetical protein
MLYEDSIHNFESLNYDWFDNEGIGVSTKEREKTITRVHLRLTVWRRVLPIPKCGETVSPIYNNINSNSNNNIKSSTITSTFRTGHLLIMPTTATSMVLISTPFWRCYFLREILIFKTFGLSHRETHWRLHLGPSFLWIIWKVLVKCITINEETLWAHWVSVEENLFNSKSWEIR